MISTIAKKINHITKRKKIILINNKILLVVLIGILKLSYCISIYWQSKYNPRNCYLDKIWNDSKTLADINDDPQLNSGVSSKNIFFHETSCLEDGVITLNARQACAIESTARINPNHDIYVLFSSQVGFRNTSALPLIDAVLSYQNVNMNYLNITRYAEGTILEDFFKKRRLFHSKYLVAHTSDILRLLSLWKYGGTYMDLDIVMLKSLDIVNKTCYAAAEYDNSVANGVLHFEGPTGREIMEVSLNDVAVNFDGTAWASNGPYLLTRTLKHVCGTSDVEEIVKKNNCEKFHILPTYMCYNINWYDRKKFFEEVFVDEVFESISISMLTHVWNHSTADMKLRKDSNAPYVQIAKKYCPKTFEASGVYF